MSVVVISPSNVATFPEGGGHFWVYMQYVQGLRQLGCEVYWLERFESSGDRERDQLILSTFYQRMERYGLGGKVILYSNQGSTSNDGEKYEYIGSWSSKAQAVFKKADLLLNFYYSIHLDLLSCFRRTALIDIDPGLLQFWMAVGQLVVPPHDYYFSTGETVGTPNAKFSDCGLTWVQIRPPVCLELWPYVYDSNSEAYTTVSGWNGGEWITDGQDICYENNKRVSFMQFVELPRLTSQVLELALCLGEGDVEDHNKKEQSWQETNPVPRDVTDYKGDAGDQKILESNGWRVRHAYKMAGSPESYQSYIQMSRGEFSCAKPSCMKFQNAWISDRTLCYLASGKPAIVQHTGPSKFLPDAEGLFRFRNLEEASRALSAVELDYERHSRLARALAEEYFDARKVVGLVLERALA